GGAGLGAGHTGVADGGCGARRDEETRVGPTHLIAAPEAAAPRHALAAAVDALGARTSVDERVLSFPACGVVPFFAGRLPAGRLDYFYPGRPDRAEMDAFLAAPGPAPPHLAVTCVRTSTERGNACRDCPSRVACV